MGEAGEEQQHVQRPWGGECLVVAGEQRGHRWAQNEEEGVWQGRWAGE